ncbi:hypothetical protein BABINDRAFT_173026 [Babjeviella inositovora NRRL Y-12698]|uniref:Mitochondrial import inner membrane translocase subunit TIM50 n=1 Tax=Babjeviella inositovora NRRL Y-12698 TaxID=984486 RepID=A0A1E3QHD8_9ASCO|nr:uncharacterized protein BABINDRAFT_173026 [Babjeviella inositovora NRRL Y-12698]ODQ77109.1 hypothetical protein BABINDRAFT_173026 [Babjeviella inositovora NRRL Y-12698]
MNVLRTSFTRGLVRSVTRVPLTKPQSVAFASTQKDEPKSILTDDLLAKAGVETENTKSADEANSNRRYRKTASDEKREKNFNRGWIVALAASLAGAGYLTRNWDSDEEQAAVDGKSVDNGYTPQLMYARLNKRFNSLFISTFEEPAYPDLLPPPPPEPYRRPLTLVLNLEDLLIHSEWSTKSGWRTAKRPGLDYFLAYLSSYYEIVVFSNHPMAFSERTVAKLDPYHAFISYPLFREHARSKDGKIVKDLSYMNRPLEKLLLIDVNEDATLLQPENSIVLAPWDGQKDDVLIKMIPFLEYLATQPVKDIRPILNSYPDKSQIATEFARRESILRANFEKENKNKGNSGFSLLGVQSSKGSKFPLDVIREQGQMQYESFMKYLRENGDKLLEEEKKMMEQQKMSLGSMLSGEQPTVPVQEK